MSSPKSTITYKEPTVIQGDTVLKQEQRPSVVITPKVEDEPQVNEKPDENTSDDTKADPIQAYFSNIQAQKGLTPEEEKISRDSCNQVVNSITQLIVEDKIEVAAEPRSLEQLLVEKSPHNTAIIEKNIKEAQLKKQQKTKEELELRLRYVEQDISMIKQDIDPLNVSKIKNAQSRPTKEMTEEEKKAAADQVKEFVKQRKQMEEKRAARIAKENEARRLEDEQKKQKEEEELNQKEIAKKEKLKQKLEEQKKLQEEREEKAKQASLAYKKIQSSVPLFEKIQKKQNELEGEALEQKKTRLAEIRAMHQPIRVLELREHSKRFEENLKQVHDRRQEDLKKSELHVSKPSFISEAYKRAEQERKKELQELRISAEEEKKRAHMALEKVKEFMVKTKDIKVKIDEAKKQQKISEVNKLIHKPNFKWFEQPKKNKRRTKSNEHSPDEKEKARAEVPEVPDPVKTEEYYANNPGARARKLGNEYLAKLKSGNGGLSVHSTMGKSASHQGLLARKEGIEDGRKSDRVTVSRGNMMMASIVTPTTMSNSNGVSSSLAALRYSKIDYLADQRRQRNKNRGDSDESYGEQEDEFERIMKSKSTRSMGQGARAQFLMMSAERLEERAMRKEQLLRAVAGNLGAQIDLDKQIHDDYVHAIKAKFAIIEQSIK